MQTYCPFLFILSKVYALNQSALLVHLHYPIRAHYLLACTETRRASVLEGKCDTGLLHAHLFKFE